MKFRLGALGLAIVMTGSASARADEVPEKYRPTVEKALKWLADQQSKDGHWGGNAEQSPVSMSSLAGVALLMEGSTIREGKYSKNIRRVADFLMDRCQKGGGRDGLIGNPEQAAESHRYMYGHGFALLFLSCVYGDEEDKDRRERLKDILTRAVKYSINSQSSRGGWYYTSRTEGGDNDEGSVTITQIQALRAARNAGIPVPKAVVKKTQDYLKECTDPTTGGVYYSFRSRNVRPAITAAAISCLFNAGEYKGELCKKWFKFCCGPPTPQAPQLPLHKVGGGARGGHDEYTHFYFAQSMYILGEDGWEKLTGTAPSDGQKWTSYREKLFDHLVNTQSKNDGSWLSAGWGMGPVYSTAMYATIMQLDKGTLPIFAK
jgi:hypothetical protein